MSEQYEVILVKVLARFDVVHRSLWRKMEVSRDAHVPCFAQRRGETRLRVWWRQEQFAFLYAVALKKQCLCESLKSSNVKQLVVFMPAGASWTETI